MNYRIRFSCVSHTGHRRSMNQDNFICGGRYMPMDNNGTQAPLTGCVSARARALFGVFDGMGGEERGEAAAFLAARRASAVVLGADLLADLSQYCRAANEEICQYARDHAVSSMGTTAALLAFAGKEIALCNIGDSKIFRFSHGALEQISQDHVGISAYGTKPPLSQNLGIPPTELVIEPYLAHGKCVRGDVYLICSDGLTDMLPVDEIRDVLGGTPFDGVTGELLRRALERGGKDNVSILVCGVERERGWRLKKRENA